MVFMRCMSGVGALRDMRRIGVLVAVLKSEGMANDIRVSLGISGR